MAQNILNKVREWKDTNDEDDWTPEENYFIGDISCYDWFWYWLTNNYFKAKYIVEEAINRELIFSELKELEEIWSDISFEF